MNLHKQIYTHYMECIKSNELQINEAIYLSI